MTRQASPSARYRPIGMMTSSSDLPYANTYMEQHRRNVNWKSHERRLSAVKSNVNNKNSTYYSYPGVCSNPKRTLRLEEENDRINRENQLLVAKLKSIQQPTPLSRSLEYTHRPGVRLAPGQRPKLDNEKTHSRIHGEPLALKPRRDEMIRIARENERISQRLLGQRGVYSRQEFYETAQKQEKLLASIKKIRPYGGSRSTSPSLEGTRSRMTSPFSSPYYLTGSLPPSRGSYSRPGSRPGSRAGMADSMPGRPSTCSVDGVRPSRERFASLEGASSPPLYIPPEAGESLSRMLPDPEMDP